MKKHLKRHISEFASMLKRHIIGSPKLLNVMNKEQAYVHSHFCTVLRKKNSAIDKDFFSLGGTLADATVIIATISKELGEEIRSADFVKNASIESFALYLSKQYPFTMSAVSIMKQQRELFSLWTGLRKTPNSLIVGQNTKGSNEPLFWCFHSEKDILALADCMGAEQPIYGMRSGYTLYRNDEDLNIYLASCYAKEILSHYSQDTYVLGGSCQGAHIMWHVAQILLKAGKRIELLCLLDATIKKKFDGRVALFYGEENELYNPFKNSEENEMDWLRLYGEYSVDFLNADHGRFFMKQHVPELANKLAKRLADLKVNA